MKLYLVIIVDSLSGEERRILVKARSLKHAEYIVNELNIMEMFEYIESIL